MDRGELRRYVAALQRRRPDLPLYDEVDSIFSSLDKDRSGILSFAEVRPPCVPLPTASDCFKLLSIASNSF